MARLIDADKLRKDVLDLPDCYNGFSDTYDKARILDLVDEQPTVDPVRHGHWVDKAFEPLRCSVCGITVDAINGIPWSNKGFMFCPNCGAKMDEVTEYE